MNEKLLDYLNARDERIIELVTAICNTERIGCRSLNKSDMAKELLSLDGIAVERVRIYEIPVDWENQVVICFELDNKYYEAVFGIEEDSKRIYAEYSEEVFDKDGELFESIPIDVISIADYVLTPSGEMMSKADYIRYSIATHGGKMSGISSISTSVLCNQQCRKNAEVDGSVCAKCYAREYASYRQGLADKLESNYRFYNNVALNLADVPYINNAIFRFEAFGDLASVQQFANYCTIAEANPQTRFVLWTKNYHFIEDFILHNVGKIPSNLYIIVSSLMINKPIKTHEEDFYIDGVFTVYDKQFIKEHDIDINCGGRKCLECRKCYSLEHGQVADIREQLK